MRASALFALLLLALPAKAQDERAAPATVEPSLTIAGIALALDGDTIRIGEQRIRLFGIDAPEMSVWPWGPQARAALDDLIAGRPVTCEQRDPDRYDRPVAVCGTSAVPDLAEAMLQSGHATVDRVFTTGTAIEVTYGAAERTARFAEVQIWETLKVAPTAGPRWMSWLYPWQALVVGFLAFGTALIGAIVLIKSTRIQVKAAETHLMAQIRATEGRETKKRLEDSKATAAALLGELKVAREIFGERCQYHKNRIKYLDKFPDNTKTELSTFIIQSPDVIFQAVAKDIGILGHGLAGIVANGYSYIIRGQSTLGDIPGKVSIARAISQHETYVAAIEERAIPAIDLAISALLDYQPAPPD